MVKPIPDGYATITPYLYVKNSIDAIRFYAEAFGGVETMRLTMPDGSLAHAEIRIGNSIIMLSDENPEWGTKSPLTLGGTATGFCLYTEDCDAMFQRAIQAGAQVMRPIQDQFYGDRSGTVTDPFGHNWTIATHKEDVSQEEGQRRMMEWLKEAQG